MWQLVKACCVRQLLMVWNCVLHVTHARDEWFQISSENRLCTLKHTWSHVNNIQIFLISLPQATTAAALTAPATNQQQPFNQINLIHEISSNTHMTGGRRYSKRIFNRTLTGSQETWGTIKHVRAMLRENNYRQGLQDFICGVFRQSFIICIILSVVKNSYCHHNEACACNTCMEACANQWRKHKVEKCSCCVVQFYGLSNEWFGY